MPKFVRRGREFWAKLIGEFQRAGGAEPHAEFAGRHGIRVGSFQRWLYRLRAEEQGRRWGRKRRNESRRAARVPWPLVEVQPARTADIRFEIELPGGRRLLVPESFDANALQRLLAIFNEKPAA
jgi:hypothetical protein